MRLHVILSDQAAADLDAVCASREATRTEIVRRALALYKLCEDVTAAGGTITVSQQGAGTRVVIL